MQLLIVGATGLVGSQVLQQALADSRITRVVAPVRRALPAHPRLLAPIVDFEHLPEGADWWRADALVCTLGTTIKTAGSQPAFRRVDHDYPLLAARLAHRHGTPTYVLNSAMGADAGSRIFYNRVKGELEDALKAMDFTALVLAQPSLLLDTREGLQQPPRLGEKIAIPLAKLLAPLLPGRYRPVRARAVALALLRTVPTAQGLVVLASDDLARIGRVD